MTEQCRICGHSFHTLAVGDFCSDCYVKERYPRPRLVPRLRISARWNWWPLTARYANGWTCWWLFLHLTIGRPWLPYIVFQDGYERGRGAQ